MRVASGVREDLLVRAREACSHAYAPYSQFPVGAAVADSTGRIFAGCNVENACFGLTQCAERNAIGAAIAAGITAGELTIMLVFTPRFAPTPPCGACRQVMLETLSPGALVIACSGHGAVQEWPVKKLLPDPFLPQALDRER